MNSVIIYDQSYWSDPIWHNIWWSLVIQKGAWFVNPKFGSIVNTIKTTSPNDLQLLAQAYESALAWLVNMGRLASVSANAFRAGAPGFAEVDVTIVRANTTLQTYKTFTQVA